MRKMPAVLDNDGTRAWDQPLIGQRMLLWEQPIMIAPEQQRRHTDAMQPFLQLRVVAARLPDQPCGRRPVLQQDILEFRPPRAREGLIGELLVVKEIADPLLVIAQEGVG